MASAGTKIAFEAFRLTVHFFIILCFHRIPSIQRRIQRSIQEDNSINFDGRTLRGLQIIGGLDISFFPGASSRAIVALSIVEFPSLKV